MSKNLKLNCLFCLRAGSWNLESGKGWGEFCHVLSGIYASLKTSTKYMILFYYRYDPQTNRWGKVASMSTRRLGVGVAVLGAYLYAVGGSDGTSPLNSGLHFILIVNSSVYHIA